jgi:hypothetical protein
MEPGYTLEELESMIEECWLEFLPDSSDVLRLHVEAVAEDGPGETTLRQDFSLTEMVHALIDMTEDAEGRDHLRSLSSRFESLARQMREVARDLEG